MVRPESVENPQPVSPPLFGREPLFDPRDVERAFLVACTFISLNAAALGALLALVWDWGSGWIVTIVGVAIAFDGLRRIRSGARAPVLAMLLAYSAATYLTYILAPVPDGAVAAPSAFFITAAALVLSRRRSVGLALYIAAWCAAVLFIEAPLIASQPTAVQVQGMIALSVVLYLGATFLLTWIAAAAVRHRQILGERLEASRAQLQTVVDGSPVILFAVDDNNVVRVSEGAGLAAIGLKPGEAVGVPIEQFLEDSPEAIELLDVAVSSGAMTRGEVNIGGAVFDVSVSQLRDGAGREAGVIGVATNVTEQSDNRKQLEELIRSKDEFVATVSHELRTPLASVLGLSEELRDRAAEFSQAEVDEFHSIIATQATDLAAIVEDLLVIARADIEAIAIVSEDVELATEINAVLSPLSLAERTRLAVSVDAHTVRCDRNRLRQILRNLITNALRHGGRTIDIRAREEGKQIAIEVADSGTPIPPEDQDRIFDVFEVGRSPDGKPGSIGLGLSVARRLALLMDGDLSYRHDGTASVFSLTLPASDSQPALASRVAGRS
ncbi:MAG: ATP-binding protein [Acidimicrobiia bacterium]|nr:ATP-binding protein [Acidimicrobiia bacterium]